MSDIKEKLVELLRNTEINVVDGHSVLAEICFVPSVFTKMADRLIAGGVTVGKSLSQFLHPIDAYKGLKAKYLVFKADSGKKVENCFVLRPDKDPAAVEALKAYAKATDNEILAADIYNWIGKGEPAQRWIPVTERLPEEHDSIFAKLYGTEKWVPGMFRTISNDVNACVEYEDGTRRVKTLHTIDGKWNLKGIGGQKVTDWKPLPEPPKGE